MATRMLTVSEAAEYLGISRTTLYHMVRKRPPRIAFYQITPARMRFRKQDLDAYLDRKKVEA